MSDLGDVVQDKGPSIGAGLLLGLISLVAGAVFALFAKTVLEDGLRDGDVNTLAVSGIIALAGLAGTVALLAERTRLHERGVIAKSIFGTVTLPFSDVRVLSVSRISSKSSLNADMRTGEQDLSTTLTMTDGQKRKVTLQSGTFGADAGLDRLSDELIERICAHMNENLTKSGGTTLIEGVTIQGGFVVGAIPRKFSVPQGNEFPARIDVGANPLKLSLEAEDTSVTSDNGWLYLRQGEKVVGVISTAAPNAFPMLAMLEEHSSWQLPD